VEARFTELLHPAVEPLHSRHSSPQSSVSSHSNQTPRSTHTSVRSSTSRQSDQTPRSQTGSAHISLPSFSLPTFASDTCTWLHYRDRFEALVVNNVTLSNVQKFHYLITSLQDEAKGFISNLTDNKWKFSCRMAVVNPALQQHKTHFNDACQEFMSNTTFEEGRCTFIAKTDQSCIQWQ
jgi:hypothetical protein